jgi:hypothetical protein
VEAPGFEVRTAAFVLHSCPPGADPCTVMSTSVWCVRACAAQAVVRWVHRCRALPHPPARRVAGTPGGCHTPPRGSEAPTLQEKKHQHHLQSSPRPPWPDGSGLSLRWLLPHAPHLATSPGTFLDPCTCVPMHPTPWGAAGWLQMCAGLAGPAVSPTPPAERCKPTSRLPADLRATGP